MSQQESERPVLDFQSQLEVVWDEGMQHMFDHHGLLKELAHSREHMNDDEIKSTPSAELVISQVVWDDEFLQGDESHDSLLELLSLGECSIDMDNNPIAEPISVKAQATGELFDQKHVWDDDPLYDTEPPDAMSLDVDHVVEPLTEDCQNLPEEIVEVLINDALCGDETADTITQIAGLPLIQEFNIGTMDIISIQHAFSLGDILPLGNADDVQVLSTINRTNCGLTHFGVLVLQHDLISVEHPMFDDMWRRAFSPWQSWKLCDHFVSVMMFPWCHSGFSPWSSVQKILRTSIVEIAQGIYDQMNCQQIDLKTCVLAECDALKVFNRKASDGVWVKEVVPDIDERNSLWHQLILGGECWGGEKICIRLSPCNKWSDPFSNFESVKLHLTAQIQIDNIAAILTEVENNAKQAFSATYCQVSAYAFSEIVVLQIRQEIIDACKFLTEVLCQEDKQQLVEQIMSGVGVVSEGSAHVLFNEIFHNEIAATHLEQAVFRTSGLFNDDATEVFVDTFGQVVWDEIPAAIGTYHGSLQYSAQSGNYFGDEKEVESVDAVISWGASHLMFQAISCTVVVWNDDLLNGHEYQEQVLSTYAAISRICADLDKQKMDGLNNCKKLQVYLDSSEVFAELHIRVVWDYEMLSNTDKYGSLQLLALGVLIHVSTPPHLRKQSQNVECLAGSNGIPDAEQEVDSMTLHANDSSQYLEFGVVLHSAGGVVGLLSKEYTTHLDEGHLYHICYGSCSGHETKCDCNHLVIFDDEQGICGAQYVIDERPPWRRSAFSPGNDDMTTAPSLFRQIPSWDPNDFSPWSSARFSIVGLQKFQHHSNHQTTAASNYDIERMRYSGCLNVPWDPGGNHNCFALAIAWGQAMFCGGGNVMPGTIGDMGWNVIGFGPCGGLISYISVLSSSYKGKKEKTEKGEKIFRKEDGLGRCSSSSLSRSYPPISSVIRSRHRVDLTGGHGLLHIYLISFVSLAIWIFEAVGDSCRLKYCLLLQIYWPH